MNRKTQIVRNHEERQLIVERIVALPRDLAWQGWTNPKHVARWWGPRNWTATIYEMNVCPGGVWRYRLSPDDGEGEIAFCEATYREVLKPSKLVYVDSFADENWNVVEGSEMLTTVAFEELNEGTRLSITTQFANVEQLETAEAIGMIEGYTDAIERFEQYLNQI
ncbi:SRPBCC domain-containing protein [Paenibacillus sp. L3-i20]|uniref:SRPBCC domain-containing protein n=1 Tax=Paenibacillus sp. L3-i20 TaxID=2905833 RepID=UPI001EE0C9FF|nr:SRPBCC domain-containing protein [Paenibacillus sp. L3-i20]GKU80080.1 activator of HSP90 ATPase [Paenibacillus sp. L3-i20]